MSELITGSPLIVALDTQDLNLVDSLSDRLNPAECRLKVGKELFTAHGPKVVDQLHKKGFEVFLDLKFHDIPNTVAKACRAAADMGVWMLNVHAMGGPAMLAAAQESVAKSGHPSILIAVTVLTSMDEPQWGALGIDGTIADYALRLARMSQAQGLAGVVCSAHEAKAIQEACGERFLKVTPGIRMATDETQDQKRIMTPKAACLAGVDYIVMGRPVTLAPDPSEAVGRILASFAD